MNQVNYNKQWTGERLEPGVFNETTIEHLHRYAFATELVLHKKVLDIACGEGYGSNLLSHYADHVMGVDNNVDVISAAQKKYVLPNLEFLKGNVTEIPATDHQFDIVVSFETIEHVAEHDKMMEEIRRVLKPGGLLIISTPDKKNYSDKPGTKNPFHVKELYAEEFENLLSRYFKNVSIMDQQIAFSSVITARNANGLTSYTGDLSGIKPDTGTHRLYCVALASDSELPVMTNSLFNGRSVFAEAVLEKEKMVTGTWTYRLGHALLYPAKLVRKLFK